MTALASTSPLPPPPPAPHPSAARKVDSKMLAAQAKQASEWRPIPDKLIQVVHRHYHTPSSNGNHLRPMMPSSPAARSPVAVRTRKRSMPPIPLTPALLPDLLPFIRKVTEQVHLPVITVVVALVYVNRFKRSLPPGYATEYGTSHRIFLSSVMVASKFLDDDPLTTKKLVDVTGGEVWTSKDLARIELAFLKFLKWDLRVSWQEICKFLRDQNLTVDELFPNWRDLAIDTTSPDVAAEKLTALRLGSEASPRNGKRA